MQSRPQNPEFRNNPETFTHAFHILSRKRARDFIIIFQNDQVLRLYNFFMLNSTEFKFQL